MKVVTTPLPGVLVIELDTFPDSRGVFFETYHREKYQKAGITAPLVQDNFSRSSRLTLRGLHAQFTHPQAKLVQVLSGEIWDVVADVRPDSPTFKKWFGLHLSSQAPKQVYVPIGFVHGFCVLSETADVLYKVTDLYDPSHELHLMWNDPELAIDWPIKNPVLSAKDAAGVTLRQCRADLAAHFPTVK